MRTKLRIQSLDEWELDGMEFECTLPIIKNKTIIFGAYNMNFEITDNIWYQLPEEYKRKMYNNYCKKVIKNMLVTITNITAYSFNIKFHDKLKDEIIMEEIYENFDRNRKIESFLPSCDFPYSSMSIYFQYLGEIYVEFDLDELIAYSEEERILGYSKLMKDVNYRKEREKNISSKFPFFIDTIKPDVIKPAEVMYIALHLLYKKYDFKNSQKASYLTACKKIGKIDKQNSEIINGIKLSEIMVDEAYVQTIKNNHPKGESPLKHEYLISYLGERMGKIIVYAI